LNLIGRDELTILVFRSFRERKTHHPLNMEYKLIPDWEWCLENTPELKPWVKNWYDCDSIAIDFKSANPGWCIGVVTIKWSKGVNHTLNLVVFEDNEPYLYDARAEKFYRPEDVELVRVHIL